MAAGDRDELSGKAMNPELIRRLLRYARPHARGFALSTVLLLILAGTTLVGPKLIGVAINSYLGADSLALSTEDRESGLFRIVGILLVLGVATFFLRYLQVMVTNRTGQRVIHDLRCDVYNHISTRSLRFYDRHPVGTLVTRVTNDIETLNEFFLSGIDVLFSDFIRILAITGILLWVDWRMALATLIVVPFILAWAFVFQRRARILFRRVRKEVSACNAFTNEALGGVRVVRSFGREAAVSDRFSILNSDLKDAHLATVRNFSWFFPGMELLTALGTSLVLVVGYALVRGGDLLAGDVLMFWLYLALFIEPLRQIADKYNILQSAVASGERVFRILDDREALPLKSPFTPLRKPLLDVRFENVSFSYDGVTPVLKDLNLHIEKGKRWAIVGATGSGKTTIINLLCRFYDPTAGRILISDQDLRDVDPTALRKQIGIVLQDVFLFDGTIRENLALGRTDLSDEILWACIDAGQARSVVDRLGGLGGRIRERGGGLSTGEKQLLAFARTLVHDPSILVLDEATAHIDTDTEGLLQKALKVLLLGRTAIVIAHRLSTIQDCDHILVLHKGEVRESGRHEELLRKNGLYARLHRLQFSDT
jgi:ATP-binding cassette subfamily B protein